MDATHGSKPNCALRFKEADAAAFEKPRKLRGEFPALTPQQQQLAAQWRDLAYKMALPYLRRNRHIADEVESAATMGLVKAAATYDPSTGNAFSTYATHCVRNEIRNTLRLERPLGYRRPEDPAAVPGTVGLGEHDPATPAVATQAEDREIVGYVMGRMRPRLAEVLRRRHLEGKTLQEVGDEMGITKERVRQIEMQALDRAKALTIDLAG